MDGCDFGGWVVVLIWVVVIDCGINLICLLIVDVGVGLVCGELYDVYCEIWIVCLGQGVDVIGWFVLEVIVWIWIVLIDYVELLMFYYVEWVWMVVMLVVCDVVNCDVFFVMMVDVLGVVLFGLVVEVIIGVEEVEFFFCGVVGELGSVGVFFVVVDFGGGFIEIVLGEYEVVVSYLVDIGCVWLIECCLYFDLLMLQEVFMVCWLVCEWFEFVLCIVLLELVWIWVGLVGMMIILFVLVQFMMVYDVVVIYFLWVFGVDLFEVCQWLIGMICKQWVVLVLMYLGWVDVIGGGVIVVEELVCELCEWVGIDQLIVSEYDILDGIVLLLVG